MLTRQQMEAVIDRGESIMHRGFHITDKTQLPSEADLAAGNPEAERRVQGDLQAEITRLQAQLERLQSGDDDETGPEAVPLEQLDRTALKALARERKITFDARASKQELIDLLHGAGVDTAAPATLAAETPDRGPVEDSTPII